MHKRPRMLSAIRNKWQFPVMRLSAGAMIMLLAVTMNGSEHTRYVKCGFYKCARACGGHRAGVRTLGFEPHTYAYIPGRW